MPHTCGPEGPPESIGRRIAALRQQHNWTQQALAARLAVSRVAISHIEMDLTPPSERTVTLLAGIFKLTPYELVAGTTYPHAKAERLPEVTGWYTQAEAWAALVENDAAWLERLAGSSLGETMKRTVWERWYPRLAAARQECADERERETIAAAIQRLAAACEPG